MPDHTCRRSLALTMIFVSALSSSACAGTLSDLVPGSVRGSGNRVSESRDVADFEQIDLGWGVRADIEVGPETSLVIEADDNLVPLIRAEVSDGRLVVEPAEPRTTLASPGGIVLRITTPRLVELSLSGGSQAGVSGVSEPLFSVTESGGARLTVDGRADVLNAQLSGGSSLYARDLEGTRAAIDASGGSRAEIAATDAVVVDLSGGSQVCTTSSPDVTQDLSGGSAVGPCP